MNSHSVGSANFIMKASWRKWKFCSCLELFGSQIAETPGVSVAVDIVLEVREDSGHLAIKVVLSASRVLGLFSRLALPAMAPTNVIHPIPATGKVNRAQLFSH